MSTLINKTRAHNSQSNNTPIMQSKSSFSLQYVRQIYQLMQISHYGLGWVTSSKNVYIKGDLPKNHCWHVNITYLPLEWYPNIGNWFFHFVTMHTACSIKKEPLIFDYNSRNSWSIFIILSPM